MHPIGPDLVKTANFIRIQEKLRVISCRFIRGSSVWTNHRTAVFKECTQKDQVAFCVAKRELRIDAVMSQVG
jgi:hypothetical protein